jgi:hypothetical protein
VPNLDSARAKVDMAHKHLIAAYAVGKSFINGKFYKISPKNDRKHRLVIYFSRVDPIPAEFGLLIGDVANNLRSALDHIAFAFAKPTTPKEERGIQFPLISKKIDFNGQAKRNLIGVPRNVRAAIERLQPYHRRKNPRLHALRYLQAINNWDKHRSLLVCPVSVTQCSFELILKTGKFSSIRHAIFNNRVMKAGAVVARFEIVNTIKGTEMDMDFKPTCVPVFDVGMPKEIRGVQVMGCMGFAHEFIRDEVLTIFERF